MKTNDQKSPIISEIRRVEKSLRHEMKKTERVLRQEILRVEEKVEQIDDKMKIQHDKVITAVSNFAGRVENLETENEIGSDQIRRLDKRLTALEPTD